MTRKSQRSGPEPEAVEDLVEKTKAAAAGAAQTVRSGTKAISSRIAEGTEHLSQDARQRVLAAREAALAAGRTTARAARRGQSSATALFARQPLVVGALAVALGAIIGGSLPRAKPGRKPDPDKRDELIARAERILDEEVHKHSGGA